jgi:hypothetical protein
MIATRHASRSTAWQAKGDHGFGPTSVLVIIYHILRTKKPYADLGADYFDQQDRERIERHHIHRLEQLGSMVTLIPKEAA